MYDVLIIGAGVIGGSIFRELTKYNLKVSVLEKENDVSMGTTKANSAIIHAGFDPDPESVVAKYNVRGNEMYEGLCKELDVPFKRNGAMVVAFAEENMATLEILYKKGVKMGVKGLRLLSKEETLKKEPNLNDTVVGALYAPTSGIVCPFQYTIALFENAVSNGGELYLDSEVVSIEKNDGIFFVKTKDGKEFKARYVVNAAGVYADEVHNMIAKEKFSIRPRTGEYIVFDKSQGRLFSSTIFPCPSKMGKGILVSPTVHGNLFIGPNAVDIDDKENKSTTQLGLDEIKKAANITTSKINYRESIRNFAGLRAISSTGDFIIEENDDVKGFIDVAGIKSPGLTCAPAIAEDVVRILKEAGLDLERKTNFISKRKQVRFMDLSVDERNELIRENPQYGNIVCRCESITEGEIVDAINRSFGQISIDGVKRRCRPGMGRCQGGFCSPKVLDIIAREKNISKEDVNLDKKDSFVLLEKTK